MNIYVTYVLIYVHIYIYEYMLRMTLFLFLLSHLTHDLPATHLDYHTQL